MEHEMLRMLSCGVAAIARSERHLVKDLVCFLVLFLVFLLLKVGLPLSSAIQIGADEGFELAKTQLRLKEFSLHEEAWNDQPPMHTALTFKCAEHLSPGIGAIRLITWAFSIFLLVSVFTLGSLANGRIVGIAAMGLLIVSPGLLELSALGTPPSPVQTPNRKQWHPAGYGWPVRFTYSPQGTFPVSIAKGSRKQCYFVGN